MPSSLRIALTVDAYGGKGNFSPKTVGSLGLWLDAGDSSTLFQDTLGATPASANTNPVGLWKDKSGNAAHVSQSTVAAKPTYRTNIFGGYPGVLADGSDDYLETVLYSNAGSSGITIYAVVKCISTNAFQAVLGLNPGGVGSQVTADGCLFETWTSNRWLLDRLELDPDSCLANHNAAGSDFTAGQIIVGTISTDAMVGKVWVNGGAPGSDGFGTKATMNPTNVRLFGNSDGTGAANLYIRELLIYRGAHTATEINQILPYLASRSGVTVTTATN